MKKRTLFISLALIIILTLLAPTAALAGNNEFKQNRGATSFTGAGLIYVTYMPDPIIKGNVWRYQGEIVEGYLEICDWDLLAGTVFWSDHDSVVRVDDEGNAKGSMRGTFSLARPDGSGTLEGTFNGRIRGNLYTGDIWDTGTWRSTRSTGVFDNYRASGKWAAELHLGLVPGTDIPTLLGPVTWEGKYTCKKPQIEKPEVPANPGNIIKPGNPIKPWKAFNPDDSGKHGDRD